jgi:hypothetical protein
MTAPTIYRSTDTSAPVMTGEIGKLVDLLDACLVNGYGTQPAAGWTKAYAATNYAAYRQGSGLQHYLWVNDSNAQLARVIGYTSMTGILDGVAPFPTDAQFSGGLYMRKSITASAVARPWILFATDRTFYLVVFGGVATFGTFGGGDSNLAFGQLASFLPGDAQHSFLVAATDTQTTANTALTTRQTLPQLNFATGHYLAASYTQTGGSMPFTTRPISNLYNQTSSGVGGITYPDPITGALIIEQMVAQEVIGALQPARGLMPGLYSLSHAQASFAHFDTFQGVGALLDEEFLVVHVASYSIVVRTTGGW